MKLEFDELLIHVVRQKGVCQSLFFQKNTNKMVYTQKKEVAPEPELGPGWRKVEVKRDNRVVKTLTKYWNPQGEELSYKDVKKILDSVQGKTKRKSSELQSPSKKTKIAPNEAYKKKIANMTKELAAETMC